MNTAVVLVLVSLALPACTSEHPTKGPAAVVQDFYARLSAGDLSGAMEYVPEQTRFQFPYEILWEREQIAEAFERQLGRNTRYELSDIEVIGNEVTYVLIASSDVGVQRDVTMRAVVEDGMLISIRIITH